ncbi:MAG: hypothetical protein Q9225_007370 [Loekoesia sp. 1 TL-2023]
MSSMVVIWKFVYRQEDINNIHEAKNGIPDFCLMIPVAGKHEEASDDMMAYWWPPSSEQTHHAKGPEDSVIDQDPSLLRKPGLLFLLVKAHQLRKGCKNIVHDHRTEAAEDDDPVDDQKRVVPSDRVLPRGSVIVR